LDIFIWIDDEILPVTSFNYFKFFELTGTNYENWIRKITKLFVINKAEKGYYIVNHNNRKELYLGKEWEKVVEQLDKKYVSSDYQFVISDEPFKLDEFRQIYLRRLLGLM
jgi:hypothetical protein